MACASKCYALNRGLDISLVDCIDIISVWHLNSDPWSERCFNKPETLCSIPGWGHLEVIFRQAI
jgi:hypothetical protein